MSIKRMKESFVKDFATSAESSLDSRSDEQTDDTNKSPGGVDLLAKNSLGAAQSYVASSTVAGGKGNGCGQEFSASFRAALQWADENGAIVDQDKFPFFLRRPDGHGDEHQAWFDEATNRWFKATYCNRFGLAWGRDGTATVGEYLSRLVLQNVYFGDDIQLVAFVNCSGKLRILTSQPHIDGTGAPYAEIQMWFTEVLGFHRLEVEGRIAWYRPLENLLVADAHEGNVIKTSTGALVPIDLNIVQPADDVLKWVLELIPGLTTA